MAPKISEYFLRRCQATVKDDKLTTAFFFMKQCQPPSTVALLLKICNACKCWIQSVVLQTKRRSPITPEIPFPCWETWNLLSHLTVYSHNFNPNSDVFNMSLVSQFIGTWTSLRPSVASLQRWYFLFMSLCETSCQHLYTAYVPWHSNILSMYQPPVIDKLWCTAPSSRLLIKTLFSFYPSNLPSGLPLKTAAICTTEHHSPSPVFQKIFCNLSSNSALFFFCIWP